MKILLWSLLALFLIGNAFFVLPWHFSSNHVVTHYDINYKKDSLLLHAVFPDSGIRLTLNMPPAYQKLLSSVGGPTRKDTNTHELFVNVSVFHNLDFTALAFPFYKVTSFNGVIPFYSIIKTINAPGTDSTALVGNIILTGKVRVSGICSPIYARELVERDLASILQKEMDKIEADINRPPVIDTTAVYVPIPVLPPARTFKPRRHR